MIVSLNVGSMLPLLHSATGHVFLAFAQERLTEPLIDRELAAASKVRSIDIDALRRQVRKQRFATVQGTVIPGLRATAFPIFDLQGYAVLAVTLLSNESFDPALDETVIADLEKVCADCSRSLGGHFAAA